MQFISTRGGTGARTFRQILLEGLAPDGGLFEPEYYPRLSLQDLRHLKGQSYVDVALFVWSKLMTDIPLYVLNELALQAYSRTNFPDEKVTPVTKLDRNLFIQHLSGGPTASFKDLAQSILLPLMDHELEELDEVLNILGATSGDTGSAAEVAALGLRRIRMFTLTAQDMSRFQKRQMFTIDDPNIFNLATNSPFDGAQRLVKEVNQDADFKRRYRIGAVNSINWARIIAQAAYYVYGYLQVAETIGQEIDVCIGSGNFGNAFAADRARAMGVPIRNIIVATNHNNVLDYFFRYGIYRPWLESEVKQTPAPSMDIARASNLERLLYYLAGTSPKTTCWLMEKLERDGSVSLMDINPSLQTGVPGFSSGWTSDGQIVETIGSVYRNYAYLLDPHTAASMNVALQERDPKVPMVVVETALPVKFDDTIREAVGFNPPIPERFRGLEDKPEKFHTFTGNAEDLKKFIAAHALMAA